MLPEASVPGRPRCVQSTTSCSVARTGEWSQEHLPEHGEHRHRHADAEREDQYRGHGEHGRAAETAQRDPDIVRDAVDHREHVGAVSDQSRFAP